MAEPTSPHHASSVRTYLAVFLALLTLTATTVWVSHTPLGEFHLAAALLIAALKATLIVLFFMHGLESSRLVHLIIFGALLWLAIMLGLTWSDFYTRGVDKSIRTGVPIQSAPR